MKALVPRTVGRRDNKKNKKIQSTDCAWFANGDGLFPIFMQNLDTSEPFACLELRHVQ